MNLFLFSPATGQGLVLWLPRGVTIIETIRNYISVHNKRWNYQSVMTPVLGTKHMFTTSGHLSHYASDMFSEIKTHSESLFLRPMTCPHHIMVYQLTGVHSYRDLPFKIAEWSHLFRYEASGALSGIERTRAFALPDAHLFLPLSKLKIELQQCFQEIKVALSDFRLDLTCIALSLRDPKQTNKFFPDSQMWTQAETILKEVITDLALKVEHRIGEAAFYGPKIDFQIKNRKNYEITIATLQLDFLLPRQFHLKFIDSAGKTQTPIMIHRGLVGSVERLIAILLEQNNGWLPLWLAPVKVAIVALNQRDEKQLQMIQKLKQKLVQAEISYKCDDSGRHSAAKIRQAVATRTPFLILIGDQEVKNQQISVRLLPKKEVKMMPIANFLAQIQNQIKKKL